MSDLISRQAAMEEISKQQTYKMFEGEDTLYLDANDVGSVLASLPSAQPEPCEDAVSRKLMYELGATCIARRDKSGELVALGRLDMLPSAQPENIIQQFRDYQVEWLTSHCDLELEPTLEEWIVRFLNDTAECFEQEGRMNG